MDQHIFIAHDKKELFLQIDEFALKFIHPYYKQNKETLENYPTDDTKNLSQLIQLLEEELIYLVEYPYTDKLYRDAYTHFYSRQHKSMDRDCIRVSIFRPTNCVSSFEKATRVLDEAEYFGFFIIKPTQPLSIGRSFLNPKAFKVHNFICCLTESKSHVLGKELTTIGFPHSTQDGIVHSCAETSIWSLMEYFGSKYHYYGTVLPSQIHRIQKKVSFERQLPSSGMEIHQITYALRKLGFGSVYYMATPENFVFFKKLVNDYVESGIPIILMTVAPNDKSGHAIILSGHNEPAEKKYSPKIQIKKLRKIEVRNGKEKLINSFNIIDSSDCFNRTYVAFDDNSPPYRLVSLENPLGNYPDPNMRNSNCFALAVPLYPKVYLDAVGVRDLFNTIIKFDYYGATCFDKKDTVISRFLLTSSKSYKMWLSEQCLTNNNKELSKLIISPMPKFIWLTELSKKEEYSIGLVNSFLIFDSTASEHDNVDNYLIAAFYPDKIIRNNNDGALKVSKKKKLSTPIRQYVNNLKTF